MKTQRTTTAVIIGVIVGVAVWAASHNQGFLFPVILMLIALAIGRKFSGDLKNVQAEITRRDAAK